MGYSTALVYVVGVSRGHRRGEACSGGAGQRRQRRDSGGGKSVASQPPPATVCGGQWHSGPRAGGGGLPGLVLVLPLPLRSWPLHLLAPLVHPIALHSYSCHSFVIIGYFVLSVCLLSELRNSLR